MPRITFPHSVPSSLRSLRSPRKAKYSVAGVAAAAAAAMAMTLVPGSADSGDASQSSAARVSEVPAAFSGAGEHAQTQREGIARQLEGVEKKAKAEAERKAERAEKAEKQKAAAEAAKKREAKQEASRSARRAETKKAAQPSYPNNLDGWIREAKAIMAKHGIPGSYQGIHRNILRESGGDPRAINDWDINAQNGVPSKGLLQVIKPTFDAYHVPGTSWNQYDPVANIAAACNYAADRYGSMDNVDSAY